MGTRQYYRAYSAAGSSKKDLLVITKLLKTKCAHLHRPLLTPWPLQLQGPQAESSLPLPQMIHCSSATHQLCYCIGHALAMLHGLPLPTKWLVINQVNTGSSSAAQAPVHRCCMACQARTCFNGMTNLQQTRTSGGLPRRMASCSLSGRGSELVPCQGYQIAAAQMQELCNEIICYSVVTLQVCHPV